MSGWQDWNWVSKTWQIDWKWFIYCQVLEQFFSYMTVRTICVLMRWWYMFCTRSTQSWIYLVLAHWNNTVKSTERPVTTLRHIILTETTLCQVHRKTCHHTQTHYSHWNNTVSSPQKDLSPHSDTLFSLLNATFLAEKQQIPILVFGLTQKGIQPIISSYTNNLLI